MTHRVVHQHHPGNIQYSLEDVDPDSTTFLSLVEDPDEDVKVIGYPLPEGEVWVLYTPGTSGTVDDLSAEFGPEELSDELDDMDPANRVIAIWLLNFFTEMQKEEEALGNTLSVFDILLRVNAEDSRAVGVSGS